MRKSTIFLLIMMLGSTGGAAMLWQQLRAERDTNAAFQARLTELELNSAPDTAAAPSQSQTILPSPPAPSVATAHATSPTVAKQGAGAKPPSDDIVSAWQKRERQLLRDRSYRESRREAFRQQFAQTRADAIRAVGMTPEQADRVIDLWVERNLWFLENGDTSGHGNMGAELQAKMKRRNAAEEAQVRALLGEELYADWTYYLQSSSERGEVNAMNTQLGGDAMSAAKVDTLVKAFHTERERATQEYKDYRLALGATDPFANVSVQDRQRHLDIERAANQRVRDSMSNSLSPAQLAKLDALLKSRLVPIETALRLDAGKVAKSN